MKNRIKEIREYRNLTQDGFASELGISKSNIQSYELGRRTPSDSFIKLLVAKYNINETWLLTGDGEMLAPATKEQEIAAITATLFKEEDDSFRLKLIKLVSQMSEEQIKICKEMVEKLCK